MNFKKFSMVSVFYTLTWTGGGSEKDLIVEPDRGTDAARGSQKYLKAVMPEVIIWLNVSQW